MARKAAGIASIAAEARAKQQSENAATLQSHNGVASIDADDFDRAMSSESTTAGEKSGAAATAKRGKGLLPHDSIYMHENVRHALRRHALDRHVRLQVVLREAVQDYMDKHGIKLDIETGRKRTL